MIRHRHVFVIRVQRVVRVAPAAAIGGVMDAGEEIGEIADRRRQVQPAIGGVVQQLVAQLLGRAAGRRAAAKTCRRSARRGSAPSAISGLRRRPEAASAALAAAPVNSPASCAARRSRIMSPIATPPRGRASGHRRARRAEHAEGQVLQRELGMAVGRGDPAPPRAIMGFVEHVGFLPFSANSSAASASRSGGRQRRFAGRPWPAPRRRFRPSDSAKSPPTHRDQPEARCGAAAAPTTKAAERRRPSSAESPSAPTRCRRAAAGC